MNFTFECEMSNLQKRVLTAGLPRGLPPRPIMTYQGRGRGRGGGGRVYTPIHWSKFFRRCRKVDIGDKSSFNVYEDGSVEKEGPLVVFLHGGGYSGLTWAPLSRDLTALVKCRTLAIDLRGHGCSITEDDYDLSAENMASDVVGIVKGYLGEHDMPQIILIGELNTKENKNDSAR